MALSPSKPGTVLGPKTQLGKRTSYRHCHCVAQTTSAKAYVGSRQQQLLYKLAHPQHPLCQQQHVFWTDEAMSSASCCWQLDRLMLLLDVRHTPQQVGDVLRHGAIQHDWPAQSQKMRSDCDWWCWKSCQHPTLQKMCQHTAQFPPHKSRIANKVYA